MEIVCGVGEYIQTNFNINIQFWSLALKKEYVLVWPELVLRWMNPQFQ